jgi:hypothetical protein
VVAQRALGARVRRMLLVGLRLPPRSLDPGELGLEPGELGIALGLVALGLGRVVSDSGSRPNGRSSGTRTALVPIRAGSSSSRWVAGLAPTEPGPEDPGDDFGIGDPNAINVLQRSRGPETPVTSDDGEDTGTIEVLQRSRGPETPVTSDDGEDTGTIEVLQRSRGPKTRVRRLPGKPVAGSALISCQSSVTSAGRRGCRVWRSRLGRVISLVDPTAAVGGAGAGP